MWEIVHMGMPGSWCTRRGRRLVGVVAVALAFSGGVFGASAQYADTSRHQLRLGDPSAEVAQKNRTVAAARALVRAAQARMPGARRAPDPPVQLGFMNYSLPSLSAMPPIRMTQRQVMRTLPQGGKLALAFRVAGVQADGTSARAEDVVWELGSQTATAFYELYATDRQLGAARETLLLLHRLSQTAQAMYRVGEGHQADVLHANVGIARMAEDTLRVQAMRKSMVARRDALRDSAGTESIGVTMEPQFPEAMPEQGWLYSVALYNRPMIRTGWSDLRAVDASAVLVRVYPASAADAS